MKIIQIPDEVKFILGTLKSNGFDAYIVGGCVRDSLIGRIPADWDVTTNALPGQIKALFQKTTDTGIKHGTVTVVVGAMAVEATTYRVDGKYTDNRRPEKVRFSDSIVKDLSRRDFTVNAIAYEPENGFIDPFDGIKDIGGKLLRTVGVADDRFREDALRMLRAIRFSAQLGYEIDFTAMESICRNSHLISNISHERIRDELNGILISNNPEKFRLLMDTGLLKYTISEFFDIQEKVLFFEKTNVAGTVLTPSFMQLNQTPVLEAVLSAIKAVERNSHLRWAMLLSSIHNKDLTEIILKKLRFDNKSIQRISILVKYHDLDIAPCLKAVLRAVSIVGIESFKDLLKIKSAFNQKYIGGSRETSNSVGECPDPYRILERKEFADSTDEAMNNLAKIEALYDEIILKNYCFSLKCLEIKGRDIVNLGFPPGKAVGNVLNKLLDTVIENPELNKKARLLELAEIMLGNSSIV